jgi:hypothetical protein
MHEDPTRQHLRTTGALHRQLSQQPYRSLLLPVTAELGRVLEYQERPFCGCHPLPRRLKMPRQHFSLTDPFIGKKPIRCLRVRPVLTRYGKATAYPL